MLKWRIIGGIGTAYIGLVILVTGAVDGESGYATFGIILLIIAVSLIISGAIDNKRNTERFVNELNKRKEETNAMKSEMELWKNTKYSPVLNKFNISDNTKVVTIKAKHKRDTWKFGIDNYMFLSDGKLCLLPLFDGYIELKGNGTVNKLRGSSLISDLNNYFACIQIPLDDIEHFGASGEFYREQKISGGGGGGSDLGGAIIGGVIAGGAGAVIGSRRETEAIRSEIVTHDTRETVLSYFLDGQRKTITFKHEDYQVFEDLLPQKNYVVVSEIKKQIFVRQGVRTDETRAITEQIKELAKLKDEGILTEDEFSAKKKELLAKM